jgi:RHS repeat-associated protein
MADGSMLEQTRYMPFGAQRGKDSDITVSAYQFTDQELDRETGLYNYDARLYDPIMVGFLSPDKLVPDYFDPKALHRYAYAQNNPLKYNDPDGHIPVETIADFISIAHSAYSLVSEPSWSNAGFLGWDVLAAAIPYFPGSYCAKGLKAGNKILKGADETAQQVAKHADSVDEVVDTASKVADNISDASKSVNKAPDFVVSSGGTAYPVPKGAQGPKPVINPQGKQTGTAFTGGKGGANKQVDTMRSMDPTPPRGKSPGYPEGYIKYENKGGQGVDPYTGRTIPNTQSHYPLD